MIDAGQRADYARAIRQLPSFAREAVHGFTEEQLDTRYREGGWTIRQVLHHLADSHANAYIRFRLILTEDNPTLKPYDQDLWAALSDAAHAPIAASLAMLEGIHDRWSRLIETLDEAALERTAFHPENGTMTAMDVLRTYARHGEHHVRQISDCRMVMGW